MAKIKRDVTLVTKSITVEENKYILELSQAEANVILLLCSSVCGSKEKTARKYTDGIHQLLIEANREVDNGENVLMKISINDLFRERYNLLEFTEKGLKFIEG